MTMKLRADQERAINHGATGIYVRAIGSEGWGSFDIAELDRGSLFRFLRGRGGKNLWAENVVMALMGHEGFSAKEAEAADE